MVIEISCDGMGRSRTTRNRQRHNRCTLAWGERAHYSRGKGDLVGEAQFNQLLFLSKAL
jgi:hypothetical protein